MMFMALMIVVLLMVIAIMVVLMVMVVVIAIMIMKMLMIVMMSLITFFHTMHENPHLRPCNAAFLSLLHPVFHIRNAQSVQTVDHSLRIRQKFQKCRSQHITRGPHPTIQIKCFHHNPPHPVSDRILLQNDRYQSSSV